jgi:hypothetical protein
MSKRQIQELVPYRNYRKMARFLNSASNERQESGLKNIPRRRQKQSLGALFFHSVNGNQVQFVESFSYRSVQHNRRLLTLTCSHRQSRFGRKFPKQSSALFARGFVAAHARFAFAVFQVRIPSTELESMSK